MSGLLASILGTIPLDLSKIILNRNTRNLIHFHFLLLFSVLLFSVNPVLIVIGRWNSGSSISHMARKWLVAGTWQPANSEIQPETPRAFIYWKLVKTREGRSCGVSTEVTWSRRGFNLCVAPSYGNRSVLLFREVGMEGCPEWSTGGRRT